MKKIAQTKQSNDTILQQVNKFKWHLQCVAA